MNKYLKIGLIVVIVIVVALLATIWAIEWSPSPPGPARPPPPIPGDVQWFFIIQTIITTVNVTFSIILLTTYISLYKKIQFLFTIGLIIFSLVLLRSGT